MDIFIIALLFSLVLALLIVGAIKKQYLFLLFSGILLMFCGIWVLHGVGHVLDYSTTTYSNTSIIEFGGKNTTQTTTTQVFTEPDANEVLHKNHYTDLAGILMAVTGLMLILISIVQLFSKDNDIMYNPDEQDEKNYRNEDSEE